MSTASENRARVAKNQVDVLSTRSPSRTDVSARMMRNILWCCCFILMVASAGAQLQDPPEVPSPGNGIVAGRAFCADTQKPARFAQVRLYRTGDGSGGGGGNGGVTGADGSFTISDVRAGDYFISAQMPGYIDPLRSFVPRGARQVVADLPEAAKAMLTKVTVAADQTATVQVTLYRGAVLAGTLTYDDGTPAIGVPVSAQRIEDSSGTGVPAPSQINMRDLAFSISSDRGDFRLGGLPEGVYSIRARPRGTNGPGTLPVYYGNTLRKSDARRLEVKAGEERNGLDIQIPAMSLRQVSGVVQAAKDSHGIARAMVSLTLTGEGGDTLYAVSGMDGSFSFLGVPHGKFTLRVNGASDAAGQHSGGGATADSATSYGPAEQNIELNGGDVDNVVLSLPAIGVHRAEMTAHP